MSEKVFESGTQVLRIYTVEKDHLEGLPLYEWIVQRACSEGIAGATVIRGIGGYCLGNPVLAPDLAQLQINRPVIVEIIDRAEDIEKFVLSIDNVVPRGIMTVHDVGVRYYGCKKAKPGMKR